MGIDKMVVALLVLQAVAARWVKFIPTTKSDFNATLPPSQASVLPQTCGKSTVQQSRVVGGQNAKPGAWPWNVMLRFNGYFLCGGVLIAPSWILTAAHCTDGYTKDGFQVVLGDYNRLTYDTGEQVFKVLTLVRHRSYDQPTTFNNDISIMQLDRPAMLTINIFPVCLPKQNHMVKVGKLCYISGWGRTLSSVQSSHILQQAALKVISFSDCWRQNVKIAPITDEMICAANIKPNLTIHSGCHGDSGGPLVCVNGNGVWELHGIVSWGSASCNTTDAYTVFARVSKYRYWIENIINMERMKKVIT